MIGLIMAVIVLGGFGLIYVFVFDAEMQGKGVTVESVIRNQTEEIDSYNHQIAMNKQVIEETGAIEAKNAKIDALAKTNTEESLTIEELKAKAVELRDGLVATTKDYNAYIGTYRNYVRTKAVGEKLPEIKLKSGQTYTSVEIREVSEIGIQIRHTDGQKRIAYEELSDDWQERFQYDPEEKAKALAREQAAQRLYEKSVAAEAEQAEEALGDPTTPQGGEQIDRLIRAKTIELERMKTELGRLQAEAVKVETEDSLNRPKGKANLEHVRGVRGRMQAAESKIRKLAIEIAGLKSKKPR